MRFARPGRGPPSRTGRLAPRCKVKRNDFALTFSTYVKLMGVQIPLSIIAMPLRRAYALPGAIFLVSA